MITARLGPISSKDVIFVKTIIADTSAVNKPIGIIVLLRISKIFSFVVAPETSTIPTVRIVIMRRLGKSM